MRYHYLAYLPLILVLCVIGFFMTGCVNLYAGITQYQVKTFYDQKTKQMVCCEANVISGKDAKSVVAHVTKVGNDFTVDLTEQDVNSATSLTAATSSVTGVAKAVSDTAITVQKLTKDLP